jgi:hypothetical protein
MVNHLRSPRKKNQIRCGIVFLFVEKSIYLRCKSIKQQKMKKAIPVFFFGPNGVMVIVGILAN